MDIHIDIRDGVELPQDYNAEELVLFALRHMPVSYTHLTLPTILRV